DIWFKNDQTGDLLILVVGIYNSEPGSHVDLCSEDSNLSDGFRSFSSTYFGAASCGPVELITPSPNSSYSMGSSTSGTHNFYGYITYKDFVDNLHASGKLPGYITNPDLSHWHL